jgi:hypothetical protein
MEISLFLSKIFGLKLSVCEVPHNTTALMVQLLCRALWIYLNEEVNKVLLNCAFLYCFCHEDTKEVLEDGFEVEIV